MDGGFFLFFLTALSTRKHGEIWACGRVTRTLLILADKTGTFYGDASAATT